LQGVSVRRLAATDKQLAQQTFLTMAQVFDEEYAVLSSPYLESLLGRQDFLAFAAEAGGEIIGGITAFLLPLTRLERREVFVYDIAVRVEWQRKGTGRALVNSPWQAAAAEGIAEGFVVADNEDTHALDFYRALGGSATPVTAFSFALCSAQP
jgi:aminoglycoside 3-N-acetyltransferase I